MVHVAVNKYDLEKINILEYAFGEGEGSSKTVRCAVFAFINVDNCERPLMFVLLYGSPIFNDVNKKQDGG